MMTRADGWRRWWGTLFLILAAGMLLWGRTILASSLEGVAYILYWLACIGFVFLAIVVALLDLWIVRRRLRNEQSELIQQTWAEIQREKAARTAGDSPDCEPRQPGSTGHLPG